MSAAIASRAVATLRAVLPRGGALPEHAWTQRHRAICALLWLHVAVLPVLGVVAGEPLLHSLTDVAIVAACAVVAQVGSLSRTVRASSATLGLLASSALLVHFFHGLIEMHFHFFVTIAVISLYQAWAPYLLGVGFVLLQHAVTGLVAADRVYNHPAAQGHPTGFALVHGAFLLAESVACLTYWKLTEDALDAERRQRAETESTNEALSRANRQISDLVAMVSHDLRTPVMVINGYATLARESWPELDDTERQQLVERLGRAGHLMQELLEDTLTASALEAGALEPRPRAIPLPIVLHEVLDALSHSLAGVQVEQLDAGAVVLMDRAHLKQVLFNVLSNAGKYGAPPYRITAVTEGDAVVLEVVDHGAGVPPEFVPHLFERYSRSEDARTGSQKGTGLGLYIARALLQANGGEISYERRPGGASTFVLRLPRSTSDVEAHDVEAPTVPDGDSWPRLEAV